MNAIKIIAVVLIAAGGFGLLYGGFSYTKQTDNIKLGSFELSLNEKETVGIPTWVGAGAIAAGCLLLVFDGRKR